MTTATAQDQLKEKAAAILGKTPGSIKKVNVNPNGGEEVGVAATVLMKRGRPYYNISIEDWNSHDHP